MLTDSGMAVTREMYERVQANDARLCEGLSDEDMAVLVSVTSTVMSNYAALAESKLPEPEAPAARPVRRRHESGKGLERAIE